MKNKGKTKWLFLFIVISGIIIHSCEPLQRIKVQTVEPSKINLPSTISSILLINTDTDINNDSIADTLLVKMLYDQLVLGMKDVVMFSPRIESNSLQVKDDVVLNASIQNQDKGYKWSFLQKLSKTYNTDGVLILDSLLIKMSEIEKMQFDYDVSYYIYTRKFYIDGHWTLVDPWNQQTVDKNRYQDTLFWEGYGLTAREAQDDAGSIQQQVKELGYWFGFDYASRILPVWQDSERLLYALGPGDFSSGYELAKEGNWEKAVESWKPFVNHHEQEMRSRASYNMAVASEMMGNIDLALEWANKSYAIKNKSHVLNYISLLKRRQQDFQKLQRQMY